MNQAIQLGVLHVDKAKLEELCRRHHVHELSLFGSAARGEMRADSDVYLYVEFMPGAGIDLFDYSGLILELSHSSDERWI